MKNIQAKKEGWKSISKTSNEEKIKVASKKRANLAESGRPARILSSILRYINWEGVDMVSR